MFRRIFQSNPESDLAFEKAKYDKKSALEQRQFLLSGSEKTGLESISPIHLPPYENYYEMIKSKIKTGDQVLELGAGIGTHTGVLLDCGAIVTVIDISEKSLELLHALHRENVVSVCCDMHNMPFADSTFDFIVGNGILSYVDSGALLSQLNSMLRPQGQIIFLDTLSGNPIYMINRFIHLIKGKRSLSTLHRMPSVKSLQKFNAVFSNIELKTYDTFLWLRYLLYTVCRAHHVDKLVNKLEQGKENSKYGFKFLITGVKKL